MKKLSEIKEIEKLVGEEREMSIEDGEYDKAIKDIYVSSDPDEDFGSLLEFEDGTFRVNNFRGYKDFDNLEDALRFIGIE